MPRARKKPYQVGPWSQPERIINADARSREGKALQSAIADLGDHVGGQPNAAQRMLIASTATIWVRLAMMSAKLAESVEINEGTQRSFLAWNNTLRRNLETLGLQPAAVKQVNVRLADIIEVENDD